MKFLITLIGIIAFLLPLSGFPAEPENKTKTARGSSSSETTNLLASFQVKPGFRVELVASEPLVTAPLALAFGENGRLFVAEMSETPNPPNAPPHVGRITLLQDTDADGVFDASSSYADNLAWPSALACYGGGVFVAATPEIIYLKDSSGYGVADVRKVVFAGFGGTTGNFTERELLNNFNWGLDNRVHGVAAGLGGAVTPLSIPGAAPVPLGPNNFSFDPRGLTLAPDPGPAQSGLSCDTGGRMFVSDFVRPLKLPMYEPRYFARNPFFPAPDQMIDVLSPGAPIFPFVSSELPKPGGARPPGTNRAGSAEVRQTNVLAPGSLSQSRGCLIYRGSAFPSNYLDTAFIADPEEHLVHHVLLRKTGLSVVAERPADEQNTEFLVSSDASFRPVQIVAGPEGAIYIADNGGAGQSGRIFRVVPENFKQQKPPALGKAKTYDLVAALASANGWHRDTAARLLYERRDPATAPLLTNMLNNSRLALARLHALRALDGQGALNEDNLLRALRDADERVREQALKLSEKFGRNGNLSEPLWNQIAALVVDPSAAVRYQLAFTLGELRHTSQPLALAQILMRNLDDRWTQAAVLSSLGNDAAGFFITLASDAQFRNGPAGEAFLVQLAAMIGMRGRMDEITPALNFIAKPLLQQRQRYALLFALGDGLHRGGSSLRLADRQNRFQSVYVEALDAALNDSMPASLRLEAIRLLGVSPYTFADIGDWFFLLFNAGQSQAIQSAAIAALGRLDDPRVAPGLLARWQVFSPALRREALTVMLARAGNLASVLSALENGKLSRAELTPLQAAFLRSQQDPAISQRALRVLGPIPVRRAATLEQFRPALGLGGGSLRGRETFRALCATCHRFGPEGKSVGPDLSGSRLSNKETLLRAILEPHAEVRQEYATQVIETKQGDFWIGIVQNETNPTLTLRQADGAEVILPRSNILSIQPQNWSLMPEGLEEGLTPQTMADLLEYLVNPPR